MFQTSELEEMQVYDGNIFKGIIRYNPKVSYKVAMTRPFIRGGIKTILQIGHVNYAFLDNFIMQSLNDFYKHLNEGKDENLIRQRIGEYQELYRLWQAILTAKQNGDININSYYDDLIYRLYLNGYKN